MLIHRYDDSAEESPRPGAEPRPGQLARVRDWAAARPAGRLPLLTAAAMWVTADVAHAAKVPALWVAGLTVAAAPLAGWLGERRSRDTGRAHLAGTETAAVTGGCGAWLAAVTAWGTRAAPDWWPTFLLAAAALAAWLWLCRHPVIADVQTRRRQARDEETAAVAGRAAWDTQLTAWRVTARELGLDGSVLLEQKDTRLGDARLVDVRGTRQLASSLAGRSLAERYAELEQLRPGQVDVYPDLTAGRLWITVRRIDPWVTPVMHPYATGTLDVTSEYARFTPCPATIRVPQAIGVDPETGHALTVPLWDSHGAKVIQLTGKKDAGKTTLLDCLRERITACEDAVPLQLNRSKALEDGWWARLAAASALGPRQTRKARRILRFTLGVITERGRSGRSTRVHQPTPEAPLYVLVIDEYDKVTDDEQCKQLLMKIESTCRSEGVAVVKASQRATANKSGGADNRAQTDIAIWGKFGRGGELGHVAGRDADLPDMGSYGGGAAGVFGVTDLPYDGDHQQGRTFYWGEESPGLLALVDARAASRPPHRLEPALAALGKLWAKITGQAGDDEDERGQDNGTAGDGDSGDGGGDGGPGDREDEYADDDDDEEEEGVGGARAKIAYARETLGNDPDIPEIPPGMEEHAAAVLAERQQQYLKEEFGNATLTPPKEKTVREMLARPNGVSTREAARAVDVSRRTAYAFLTRLKLEGAAEIRPGADGQKRFFATDASQQQQAAAGGGSVLRLVQPPDDGDGQ